MIINSYIHALGFVNLFPANASNATDEVDGTDGWGNSQGGGTTTTSVDSGTTAPHHGTYCTEIKTTGGQVARRDYDFTAVIGNVYTFSYAVKDNGGGGFQRHGYWTGADDGGGLYDTPPSGGLNPTTAWTQFTYTVEATATTIEVKFYCSASTGGVNGDAIYIDNLKVKDVT